MATIAIGDIHGHLPALDDVLDQLLGEAKSGDTVVFLGDYIDRGPDSKGCIDAVLNFRNKVDAEVVCLLGNHEDWFVRTLRDRSRHSWPLPNGYDGADLIVYGHRDTVTFNGDGWPAPRIVGRTIGIDTISQWVLTAIRLPDRQLFQSARHDTKRRV